MMATREHQQPRQRRQPVILTEPSKQPAVRGRCAEIAGGKTAECAAICCCCPLSAIDFIIFAAVKLPLGMLKKAVRKNRKRKERKRMKKIMADGLCSGVTGVGGENGEELKEAVKTPTAEVTEREEEMWAQFRRAGFWRSASRRESSSID